LAKKSDNKTHLAPFPETESAAQTSPSSHLARDKFLAFRRRVLPEIHFHNLVLGGSRELESDGIIISFDKNRGAHSCNKTISALSLFSLLILRRNDIGCFPQQELFPSPII